MTAAGSAQLIVTGATGRVGRMLRALWTDVPFSVLWLGRRPEPGVTLWTGQEDHANWPKGAVILHLAGVTSGSTADLAANVDMARQLVAAARYSGARSVLFASTVAVYRPAQTALPETTAPDPLAAYGASKLAAEEVLRAGLPTTVLRIGNIAGADALLGGAAARAGAEVVLDPVPGHSGGPIRSYIGPITLAAVLAHLVDRAMRGASLPPVLNIAQPGTLPMADLLTAAGLPWRFGPERQGVIPRVEVDTTLLQSLMDLPAVSAEKLVAEVTEWKARA